MINRLKYFLSVCQSSLSSLCFWQPLLVFFLSAGGVHAKSHGFNLSSKSESLKFFLDDIESRIPRELKNRIPFKIKVKFVDMKKGFIADVNKYCDGKIQRTRRENSSEANVKSSKPVKALAAYVSKKHILSNYNRIYLNKDFKSEIIKGPSKSKKTCLHGNFYRLALASVIHEIAHVYDHTLAESGEREPSKDPQFLSLIHSRRKNDWPRMAWASPDPFEMKNRYETFAVNFEHFIMDKEYACRRPGLYNFFVEYFEVKQLKSCDINRKIYLATSGESVEIDLRRLHSIRFLLGNRSIDPQGRWGHAFLHLVICPENVDQGSNLCTENTSNHLVVDFTAKVTAVNINLFSGLFGGYSTTLNIQRFDEVVNENTYVLKRDLFSYPLFLVGKQQHVLLDRIIEMFWVYNSEYFVLKNNCAQEIADLILSVLPSSHRAHRKESFLRKVVTPKDLKAALFYAGLSPPSFTTNDVLVFNSHRKVLIKSYENIEEHLPKRSKVSPDKYFELQIDEKIRVLDSILENSDSDRKTLQLASLLVLENEAMQLVKKKMTDQVHEKMEGIEFIDFKSRVSPENWYSTINLLSRRYRYGIPLSYEVISDEEIREKWELSNLPRDQFLEDIWKRADKTELEKMENFYREIRKAFSE